MSLRQLRSIRPFAALCVVIVLLLPACGAPPAEPTGGVSGTRPPTTNDPRLSLANIWQHVREAASLPAGSLEEARLRRLSIGIAPVRQELRNIHFEFVARDSSGTPTVFYVWKPAGAEEYQAMKMPLTAAMPAPDIPLHDIMEVVDSAGLSALATDSGEYALLELDLSRQEGRVFGANHKGSAHTTYELTADGTTHALTQNVVVDGVAVVLHTSPVGDTSGDIDPDKNRLYIASSLGGLVKESNLELPPLAAGQEVLAVAMADVDQSADENWWP